MQENQMTFQFYSIFQV